MREIPLLKKNFTGRVVLNFQQFSDHTSMYDLENPKNNFNNSPIKHYRKWRQPNIHIA